MLMLIALPKFEVDGLIFKKLEQFSDKCLSLKQLESDQRTWYTSGGASVQKERSLREADTASLLSTHGSRSCQRRAGRAYLVAGVSLPQLLVCAIPGSSSGVRGEVAAPCQAARVPEHGSCSSLIKQLASSDQARAIAFPCSCSPCLICRVITAGVMTKFKAWIFDW